MRIIVTGMVGTFPVGGVAWDYLQYVMGFERLGFEVWYLEDTGMWSYDPHAAAMTDDGESAASWLFAVLGELSPRTAKDRWHYRAADGRGHGPWRSEDISDVLADSDLFLNVSASCLLRHQYRAAPRRALIDTDPGWNHFRVFPQFDRNLDESIAASWREHDTFFTYGELIGQPNCRLPDLGLRWHTTRPPVVLDSWNRDGPGIAWTTVMTWTHADTVLEHDGRVYRTKEAELPKLLPLPRLVGSQFELAISGPEPPVELFQDNGWSVVDAATVSRTPSQYGSFIARSRGEVSIAKNVYVDTRSGWFSCRSACYLAAARPAVLQDTGFSDVIPTGDGIIAFATTDEAARAIRLIERNYEHHSTSAQEIARVHFGSDAVLMDLLQKGL